jgi:two-component system nitrogen regulation sensor histidine kinase NtrY
MKGPDRRASENVELVRSGHTTNLTVRISSERGADWFLGVGDSEVEGSGFVVTFDDVTPLIAAQRKAAWGDVARRIAHEIKNPLTPIQLSAERLKRKYLSQITDSPEIFEACTDTIVRQVGDLRHIVDEFSNFARLPSPELLTEDIVELVESALTLQEVAQANVVFKRDFPQEPLRLLCDRRQIGQVLNNLIKNAIESIEASLEEGTVNAGMIRVAIVVREVHCVITITDNGRGLPEVPREKLFEPYVTHRERGTGLGLAIAQRIVGDHGGSLTLQDNEDTGACAKLILPLGQDGNSNTMTETLSHDA